MDNNNFKKQSNKATYDKNFYKENKADLCMRSKLNYYASKAKIPKEDYAEMVNGFGYDETMRLLKIKCAELKLASLIK
jgi:hypothetical protein